MFTPKPISAVLRWMLLSLSPMAASAAGPGAFGARSNATAAILGTTDFDTAQQGGPLVANATATARIPDQDRPVYATGRAYAVGHSVTAEIEGRNGGSGNVIVETWDSARVAGTCSLSLDPTNLGPCIAFRWELRGTASFSRTNSMAAQGSLQFLAYAGILRCSGSTCDNFFLDQFADRRLDTSASPCASGDQCEVGFDTGESFVLGTSFYAGQQSVRDGDTIAWTSTAVLTTMTGYGDAVVSKSYARARLIKARIIPVPLVPTVTIGDTASGTATGKQWKQRFEEWEATHCPPFVAGTVPQAELTVAYLPVAWRGGTVPLSTTEVEDRAEYIGDYFHQQSMCAVTITPWIIRDPATGGWLSLDFTEAEVVVPPGPGRTAATDLGAATLVWLDAFKVASLVDSRFFVRQQVPPPFGGFDAVVVVEPSARNDLRGRALMTRQLAKELPGRLGGTLGVVTALAGPPAAVAASLQQALAGAFPTGLELAGVALAAGIPFVPRLETTVLNQGSVVIGAADSVSTWAHELGHALFTFWDYYARRDVHPFVKGAIGGWEHMGDGDTAPAAPMGVYNRLNAGWLWAPRGSVGFGDYPITPIRDLRFGEPVLQFKPARGPIDWFFFELRAPPDGVPTGPGLAGVPEITGTWQSVATGGGVTDLTAAGPPGSTPFGTVPDALLHNPAGGPLSRFVQPNVTRAGVSAIIQSDQDSIRVEGDLDGIVAPGDAFRITSFPGAGQTGLAIYQKREIRPLEGRVPSCDGIPPPLKAALAAIIGHEFGSCLDKVANVDLFPQQAQASLTVPPGECYQDLGSEVEFCLSHDLVLTIRDTGATSTLVISMEASVGTDASGMPQGLFAPPRDPLPVDLHVYAGGRHVGPNENSGAYDLDIPGARAGGAYTTAQWIAVPDGVQGTFRIDASRAVASVLESGLTQLDVAAEVVVRRYDASGAARTVLGPLHFALGLGQSSSADTAFQAPPATPPAASPASCGYGGGSAAETGLALLALALALRLGSRPAGPRRD